VTESNVEVRERARERSRETQERYLRRYCFIPAVHGGSGTPGEYIASELMSLTSNLSRDPIEGRTTETRNDRR
jgi:hypothetical protein